MQNQWNGKQVFVGLSWLNNLILLQFGNEFNSLWNRHDFYGKFFRTILSPPIETRVFDKSAGYSEMKVQQIGPRLSLRGIASQKFIMMFILAFLLGRLFLGASSLGFITFTIIAFGYFTIKAAMSNWDSAILFAYKSQ